MIQVTSDYGSSHIQTQQIDNLNSNGETPKDYYESNHGSEVTSHDDDGDTPAFGNNKNTNYKLHKGVARKYLLITYYAQIVCKSKIFNYFILLVIIVAGINVGVQTYPGMDNNSLLGVLDLCILCAFASEIVLKMLSEGLSPWIYFIGREWKWNNFDFLIVFLSLPIWGNLFGSGSVALLRLVRLMRLGKLVKKIPALQMIVQGLAGGMKSIGYILILLFLVYYLFAVVGFYMFSTNDPFFFGDLVKSMVTLFGCSTLDFWSDIMYTNIYGCANYHAFYFDEDDDPNNISLLFCENSKAQYIVSILFFVFFIVLSAMVMLSLFIGTVTMSMNQSMENLRLLAEEKKKKDLFEKNKAALLLNHAKEAAVAREAERLRRTSIKTPSARRVSSADSGGSGSPPRTPDNKESNSNSLDQFSHQSSPSGRSENNGRSPRLSVVNEETASNVSNCVSGMPLRDLTTAQIGNESEGNVDDHNSVESDVGQFDRLLSILLIPFSWIIHMISRKNAYLRLQNEKEVSKRQQNLKKYLLAALGETVLMSESDENELQYSGYKLLYLRFSYMCKSTAESKMFINFVTLVIVLAGVVIGFQTDHRVLANPALVETLDILNHFILAVFCLECFLKIGSFGLKPLNYFKDSWNKFDFIIVLGSFIPGAGSLLIILRLLRLLRVLKLIRAFPQLAIIINAMMLGISSIGYIALIMFLVFYMYAILGMMLFSHNDPWHFGLLHLAMITLFDVTTLDNWGNVMYINVYGCDKYPGETYTIYPDKCTSPAAWGFLATIYFVLFVIVSAQVLLTLFIGVVTTSMDQATETKKASIHLEERVENIRVKYELTEQNIENFRVTFSLLDLDNGGTIEDEELKIGLSIVGYTAMDDEEISRRMKEADSSSEGIDMVGFITFMVNLPKFRQRRMFLKVLRMFRKKVQARKETASPSFLRGASISNFYAPYPGNALNEEDVVTQDEADSGSKGTVSIAVHNPHDDMFTSLNTEPLPEVRINSVPARKRDSQKTAFEYLEDQLQQVELENIIHDVNDGVGII